LDKRSNRVQRADVQEEEWDRHPFLVEEGGEEDKGGKRAGYSPWRRVGIAGIAVLADTVAGIAVGIAALAGTAASALIGIALAKES
jgi:hypothetical protein